MKFATDLFMLLRNFVFALSAAIRASLAQKSMPK